MLKDNSALRAEDGPTHPPRPATKLHSAPVNAARLRAIAEIEYEIATTRAKMRRLRAELARARRRRTPEQIEAMRRDYCAGMARPEIFKRYKIGTRTLTALAQQRGWKRPPNLRTGAPPKIRYDRLAEMARLFETDAEITVREIAARYDIAASALYNYARKHKWKRAKIRLRQMQPQRRTIYYKLLPLLGRNGAYAEAMR